MKEEYWDPQVLTPGGHISIAETSNLVCDYPDCIFLISKMKLPTRQSTGYE